MNMIKEDETGARPTPGKFRPRVDVQLEPPKPDLSDFDPVTNTRKPLLPDTVVGVGGLIGTT